MTPAAFAIPGDIRTRTGGYIYERRLLEGLRKGGREVHHLELPASFPDPTGRDMSEAFAILRTVPGDVPLILDGFLPGTLNTEELARLQAPLCAIVHHPLGLESGLHPDRAAFLIEREMTNLTLMRHIIVPSRHIAATLASDFRVPSEKITVAPPGFDAADGAHRPAKPALILSVGILHPRKGHEVLLDALARISDLDWQAAIVGRAHDAAYAEALHARAAAPDSEGRVQLRGEMNTAGLQALYRSATLLALATRYEGYGMVFGEAQRHGLPIVSCDAGAVPEAVPRGAGLLVPPGDAGAFADALRAVMTDETLRERLAAGSARAGEALPTWASTSAKVDAVLDRLAG